MFKRFISIILVVAITVILIVMGFMGLALTADAAQDHPLRIWKQNENGRYTTLNVVDEATGVEYVVVCYDDSSGSGISICPRYNSDGSLYTSD